MAIQILNTPSPLRCYGGGSYILGIFNLKSYATSR